MKLEVRKTTPFTQDEYAEVQAFAAAGTPEHTALEELTPAPLRDGSEGSTLRALALLGMQYVRDRQAQSLDLAAGYDELASERRRSTPATPLRDNMARRARSGT